MIVTIDGGAASGKSSTARGVSERLGYMHVDTGSHYRALTLLCLDQGVSHDDPEALKTLLANSPLETLVEGRSARITLLGQLPDDNELRSERVNLAVSHFAAQPIVRDALKQYQRRQVEVARELAFPGLVMEGRDIGSVIFPDAPLKIFLEADPDTRANRRAEEGRTDAINERDRLDATRKTAPLVVPPGAIRIDTAALNLEQVIDRVCTLVSQTDA